MATESAAPDSQPSEVLSTLDADLREALLAAQAQDDEQEPAAPDSDDDTGDSDAPEDTDADADAEGDEPADDEDADDTKASDTPDEDEEDEPGEAITPPSHWSEGDRVAFNDLPEAGKKFLLRRHKEMEADYTRKTTEVAPLRKAMDPFRGEMERLGMNEAQAMSHITGSAQQLWQYQQALQQNPQAVLQAIAQQYGVNLNGQNKTGEWVDPDVRRLEQQLQQVTGTIQQERQQRELQQRQDIQRTIDEFAVDHPHFDDLKVTMGALMNAGQAKSLDDAYEKAQWSHPEIRERILSQKADDDRKRDQSRKRDKVKKARGAATAVSTTRKPAPEQPPSKSLAEDLRDELKRQLNG